MGLRVVPTGPLPATTYWRRRAVSLAVVVLLLLVVLRACGGADDDEQLAGNEPTTAPGPSVSAPPPTTVQTTAPTTTAPTTTAPTTTASARPSPTTSAAAAPDCTAKALRVVASSDARRYPRTSTARLRMRIQNIGTAPCRAGVGQGSLEFRINSGQDRIWSSDDCSPGGAPGLEVFAPAEQRVVELSWSLVRSAPGCLQGRPSLQPGTYQLSARVRDLASEPVAFAVV